jgi:hypothetical protein
MVIDCELPGGPEKPIHQKQGDISWSLLITQNNKFPGI